jgi:hypothetical protein
MMRNDTSRSTVMFAALIIHMSLLCTYQHDQARINEASNYEIRKTNLEIRVPTILKKGKKYRTHWEHFLFLHSQVLMYSRKSPVLDGYSLF